jgi:anti-sigma factor RsiW
MREPRLREANVHWSDEDLLNRLYGAVARSEAAAERHLESCPECAARWEELRRRRATVLAHAAAGPARPFDGAAFWARVEARRSGWAAPWLRTAMTGALLAAGVLLLAPAREPVATPRVGARATAPNGDDELLRELSTLSAPEYLSVGEPVRALFEEAGPDDEESN